MERYLMILKSYKRMPCELEDILRHNIQPLTVRKHDIIQPPGTVTDYIYFIEKGLFQLFTSRDDGQHVTLRFKKEDEFIISLKDLFPDEQRHWEGIEALEDGVLWLIPGNLVSTLRTTYMAFTLQFGIMITNDWVAIGEASHCSRPGEGLHNYYQLRLRMPYLLDRVPIRFLASYTDLSEERFHRLRSRKIQSPTPTSRRQRR